MIRSVALALLAAVAIVGGLRLLGDLAATDFRIVRVEGELTARERDQVRAAVAAGLERAGARSVADVVDVVERLDWVREVRARRHWPDALHIAVRRETPVARWGEDAWLSTSGAVVPTDELGQAAALRALPTIAAERADGVQAMEVFQRISATTAAEGLRIVALTENKAGDWSATFADGAEVKLGRTALRERTERFVAVYRAHLRPQATTRGSATPNGELAHADARYANGVAVRWVPQAAPAEGGESPIAPGLALASAASARARLAELGFGDGE